MSRVILTLECPSLLLTSTGFWPRWRSTEAWKWRRSCSFAVCGTYTTPDALQRPCELHRIEKLAVLVWEYQVVVLVGQPENESVLHLSDLVPAKYFDSATV